MSAKQSYTPVAKFLHWLIALMWITVWIIGIICVYGNYRGIFPWHKGIATAMLALVIIRILWRLTHTPPALPDTMSNHAKQMAKLGHIALYLFALLAMPISGWLLSSLAGRPVLLAGLYPLPALASPNAEYARIVSDVHFYLAWFCAVLILGHILVSLKHHFIDKDNVLMSMAPDHSKKK